MCFSACAGVFTPGRFWHGYKRALEDLEAKDKQREKWREVWHARKKPKAYLERKRDTKAEWQAANPEKNVAYVQAFRERWGRWPAKAEKRVDGKPTAEKRPAAKATKKVAKPKPEARQADRAPGKKARRP